MVTEPIFQPSELNQKQTRLRTLRYGAVNQKPRKEKQTTKTRQETKAKSEGLELTERQIEDFTRLAQLQKDGAANIKDRRLITDAYRAFAAENEEALSAEGGVRAGRLKVWIEVTRAIHAAIVE